MQLRDKNILLISPEPWGECFVSKHHYAVELAKRGNRVFFLNPPRTKKIEWELTKYNNLWVVDYPPFIKGLRFFPSFIQRALMRHKKVQLEKKLKVRFDIVWSFDNSVFYDFSAFGNEVIKICHIVDLNQDFQMQKAANSATFCFGASHSILSKIKEFNINSAKINHGNSNNSLEIDEVLLPGHNKTKALYAGNLDSFYLDWVLVESVINSFPEVDFVFAGPFLDASNKNMLLKHDNAFLLGLIPGSNISNYYRQADILLVFYLYEHFPEQLSNPHKVMEYLASGKPVVATWTEEYSDTNLLYMARGREGYLDLFRWVISHMNEVNEPRLVKKRITYARAHTYQEQVNKIERYLAEVCV